ncbi:unnamed protein product [Alopecurus aequalis]
MLGVMASASLKRKRCSYGASTARNRQETGGSASLATEWSSLPLDIAGIIAERLLAEDVTDYMSFRAVCSHWRATTPSPCDPTLQETRFRPRGWVALCDGDGIRPADACEITFLHTSTGRHLRVRLPELQDHQIVGFTDGLLILLNKATTVLRVLHPFTRVVVDLPPLAPIFRYLVKFMESRAWMKAAVCWSYASIAVVAWFPIVPVVIYADPGKSRCVFGCPTLCYYYLVEFGAHILLAVQHRRVGQSDGWKPFAFAHFLVDVHHRGLVPLAGAGLGDHALFLCKDRCLCVSAGKLPSISISIYFALPNRDPVVLYSLSSGTFERTSTFALIHDLKGRIRPSVRPFTLADHLTTYCHHFEW